MEEIKAVNAMGDEDIDFSDIPPLPPGWSKNAKRFDEVFNARKEAVSVRIDADVLMWLKAGGEGYHSAPERNPPRTHERGSQQAIAYRVVGSWDPSGALRGAPVNEAVMRTTLLSAM